MHYRRNQYSEGVSICSLIIAGFFIYWGISNLLEWGGWWWWGIICLGIGASILISQIYAFTNRGKLRNVVKHEFAQNPNATVEDIARSTRITIKDVRDIILDLKGSGEFQGKFSTKTGALKHSPTQITEKTPGEKGRFCPSCGTAVKKEEAMYCAYCGSKI